VFNALTDGNRVLVKDTHYEVSGNTYTLLNSYLNTLEPGVTELTFNMNAGIDPVAQLFVSPGTPVVSPLTPSHILGSGGPLEITLTRNGRTLSTIKNGATTLVAGVDYTVVSTNLLAPVFTVSTNYLNTLPVGTATLTFDMTFGTDPTVAITVQAGNATVTPDTVTYAESNLEFTLARNGTSLLAIKNGSTPLIAGNHYTINNFDPLRPVYTILTGYLDLQGSGTTTLTFDMDGGIDPSAAITIP
jgi:hypothetical protein